MGTQWGQLCLVGSRPHGRGDTMVLPRRGGRWSALPLWPWGGGGLFWWPWFSRPPSAALKEIQTNRRGSCAAET